MVQWGLGSAGWTVGLFWELKGFFQPKWFCGSQLPLPVFGKESWRTCPIAFCSRAAHLVIPKKITRGFKLPDKKAVWNRVKLPNSDGIFCQGIFPGNSRSKTKHSQGARLPRDCGVPWYKADKGQWLTLQSQHRCHGDKTGQGFFKSLWAPILFQRNNQLLLHSSRPHSWEVSVGLNAAAHKGHSSVPAQQAPLVAVSGLGCCPVPLLPQHWFGFFI